jgi:NadR type nicotinamide-nucleotide adenylyltransferase
LSIIKKIVIIGPESTGKSELCTFLATYYHTVFVPEYAREYLEKQNGIYHQQDLIYIAQGQQLLAEQLLPQANGILLYDTNEIVLQVWSEVKYNACDKYILDAIVNNYYDFYVLMNIDLPWQFDALRDSPDLAVREKLLLLYKHILQNSNTPFAFVSGVNEERNRNAVIAIDAFLSK